MRNLGQSARVFGAAAKILRNSVELSREYLWSALALLGRNDLRGGSVRPAACEPTSASQGCVQAATSEREVAVRA